MFSPSPLDNVNVVLVDTKTPGNIGAVARCMMNMGLSNLVLVRPPADRNGQALKLAAGAHRILENARMFSTLSDAVSDFGLVVGSSRHRTRRRKNVSAPAEIAEKLISLLGGNRVAIVFGNEVNGLDNDDISLCHELISIPSSSAFPSLNVSHAVMVVAYELFLAARVKVPVSDRTLAPSRELEDFYKHLRNTLQVIGFIDRAHPEHMMNSLRQLFGRARLDSRDVSILRGILHQMERAAKIQKI
ncbi:MAG TPA: RNA methyltransferase [Nitrospirota bacterium]|nr:RNA methyltransferase [Nitrospirota bacterium]